MIKSLANLNGHSLKAGRATFHFSKRNVGSVMSVMFVEIRPGALGSQGSTEVHGKILYILGCLYVGQSVRSSVGPFVSLSLNRKFEATRVENVYSEGVQNEI